MARPVRCSSDRIRPVAALRAIRALIQDPDDTARVFDVIDALSGRTGERLLQRFCSTPHGARLLRERPDLLATLCDRGRLRRLPAGTLGRAYADFMDREQISPDGLVEASQAVRDAHLPEERRWLGDRLRDMHDLWHVTTGYDRDLRGEAALLAFTYTQTRNPGIGFIVAVAYLRFSREGRAVMGDAIRRGRGAAWLPAYDWESALERPLAEVRSELRLGAPPTYVPVRSAGAPVLSSSPAQLAP